MTFTDNLSLHKPDYDDCVDIEILNKNMDIVDEEISNLNNSMCELLCEYTVASSMTYITNMISADMYSGYRKFYIVIDNKDNASIAVKMSTTSLDTVPAYAKKTSQYLYRTAGINLATMTSSSTLYYSDPLYLTASGTRSNELTVEVYGVKY